LQLPLAEQDWEGAMARSDADWRKLYGLDQAGFLDTTMNVFVGGTNSWSPMYAKGSGGGGGPVKPKLAISATDAVKPEGQGGGVTLFTFTVMRTGDTSGASSAIWSVTGSGGDPANDADFTAATLAGGVVYFAAGVEEQTITVEVVADGAVEGDEGFTVTLSGASKGTTIDIASANGTIQNDDSFQAGVTGLSIAATDAVKAEGNGGGSTAFTFTVTREGDLSGESSVDWEVAGSGADPADADDFGGALPSGTVAFAAGEAEQTITVLVSADGMEELSEGFTVTLVDGTEVGADILIGSADGSIVNDDGLLTTYLSSAPGSGYNIFLTFTGTGWTTDLQAVVTQTADLLSSIITGDVSDIPVYPFPVAPSYLWGQYVDDIAIEVNIGDIIDDPDNWISNVVAQTEIMSYRDAGDVGANLNELYLPVASLITLDNDDVASSSAVDWQEILLHEMIHAVGFSYGIFDLKGMLEQVGHGPFTTYNFAGGHAERAYAGFGDWLAATGGASVPMTWDGSHWDEVNFNPTMSPADWAALGGLTGSNEVMTTSFGSLGEDAWLSDVTVAVLADLGYTVADPSAGAAGVRVDTLFA